MPASDKVRVHFCQSGWSVNILSFTPVRRVILNESPVSVGLRGFAFPLNIPQGVTRVVHEGHHFRINADGRALRR